MSSSTVDIIFLATAAQCGFGMENVWRGLWEVMAANSLVGLEAQAKKSVNRNGGMIRTNRKLNKAATSFRNFCAFIHFFLTSSANKHGMECWKMSLL